MTPLVLITGGGGYVGARLAEQLLAESDASVVLWAHRDPLGTADADRAPLPPGLRRFGQRVRLVHGELGDAEPFAGVDPAGLTHIVHAAAVTRFNVDAETADRVNVEGTRKLLELAERCGSLEHLTLVSTLYASGLRAGAIPEAALDGAAGFANHYERSKWESERLLVDKHAHLPATIARVATVIADDETGAVTQKNAVHNTLRLFFHGLLSLVPGHEHTPLYFVTGDFVARALARLTFMPPGAARPAVAHVCHTRAQSGTLGQLVDTAFQTFEADAGFKSRRILRPLFADAESFEMLNEGIEGFGGDTLRQALGSVAPFARQLFVDKDCKNDQLVAATGLGAAPEPRALAARTIEWLVKTRWGRLAA